MDRTVWGWQHSWAIADYHKIGASGLDDVDTVLVKIMDCQKEQRKKIVYCSSAIIIFK
jgi:hypothetical protein